MASRAGLSAAQLLEIVDAGAAVNAVARGRLMLAVAVPDLLGEQLDDLSLGDRDAWVLELRCGTFGDELAARVRCPNCAGTLSARIPHAHVALQALCSAPHEACVVRVTDGDVSVEARTPDGAALAAAACCADVAAARASLVSSCVSALRDGAPLDPLELDDALLRRVGEAIVEAEPQVEVRVPMSCAACGHEWAPVLDVVHFFWRELSASSVALLDEVHQLAIGYGWSEEQVLRLSPRRRRQYVERLADG